MLDGKTEEAGPRTAPQDLDKHQVASATQPSTSNGDTTISDPESLTARATADAEAQSTSDAVSVVQRWCRPRGNIARLAFAFLSFFIAGMNDAAVGVCPISQTDLKCPLSLETKTLTDANRHSYHT